MREKIFNIKKKNHINDILWDHLAINYELSEEFIEKYQDNLSWFWIAKYQELSWKFISKFYDKLINNFLHQDGDKLVPMLMINNKLSQDIKDRIRRLKIFE